MAQGFSQVPGMDYFDMYAPVARLTSIRTVLAFAAAEDLETGQIDIKGAYLNGELTEDEVIYMKQPPSYAVRTRWENTHRATSQIPLQIKTSWTTLVSKIGGDNDQVRIFEE